MTAWFLGCGFFVIVFTIIWSIDRRKRTKAQWQRAATALGLRFHPGGAFRRNRISGHLDGFRVQVETLVRSSGKHSHTYTVFKVHYSSLKLGLDLKKQGFWSRAGKLFGARDIEVGDHSFDRSVVVRALGPGLRDFLTPSRRLRIRRFLTSALHAKVTDRWARFEVSGIVSSSLQIRSNLRRAIRLAECLTTDEASEKTLSDALDRLREGDLNHAIELLERAERESPDDDHEAALVAGEVLIAAGEAGAAAEVLAPLAAVEPDADADSVGWVALAEARKKESEDPAPPPLSDQEEPRELTVETAIESLFGNDLLSFEVQRRFDEQFAGRAIEWTGELVSLTRFQSDRIFGATTGVRATFELTPVLAASYYARTARAIVQLPEEAVDELQSRTGATLAFHGVLAACDAFARTVFVRLGTWAESGSSPIGAES